MTNGASGMPFTGTQLPWYCVLFAMEKCKVRQGLWGIVLAHLTLCVLGCVPFTFCVADKNTGNIVIFGFRGMYRDAEEVCRSNNRVIAYADTKEKEKIIYSASLRKYGTTDALFQEHPFVILGGHGDRESCEKLSGSKCLWCWGSPSVPCEPSSVFWRGMSNEAGGSSVNGMYSNWDFTFPQGTGGIDDLYVMYAPFYNKWHSGDAIHATDVACEGKEMMEAVPIHTNRRNNHSLEILTGSLVTGFLAICITVLLILCCCRYRRDCFPPCCFVCCPKKCPNGDTRSQNPNASVTGTTFSSDGNTLAAAASQSNMYSVSVYEIDSDADDTECNFVAPAAQSPGHYVTLRQRSDFLRPFPSSFELRHVKLYMPAPERRIPCTTAGNYIDPADLQHYYDMLAWPIPWVKEVTLDGDDKHIYLEPL